LFLQLLQIIWVEELLRRYQAFFRQKEPVRLFLVSPDGGPDGEQLLRHRLELRLIGIPVVELHTCRVTLLFVTRQSIQ
jgi:hypothetical protein